MSSGEITGVSVVWIVVTSNLCFKTKLVMDAGGGTRCERLSTGFFERPRAERAHQESMRLLALSLVDFEFSYWIFALDFRP